MRHNSIVIRWYLWGGQVIIIFHFLLRSFFLFPLYIYLMLITGKLLENILVFFFRLHFSCFCFAFAQFAISSLHTEVNWLFSTNWRYYNHNAHPTKTEKKNRNHLDFLVNTVKNMKFNQKFIFFLVVKDDDSFSSVQCDKSYANRGNK